jgi:hypothetical protein
MVVTDAADDVAGDDGLLGENIVIDTLFTTTGLDYGIDPVYAELWITYTDDDGAVMGAEGAQNDAAFDAAFDDDDGDAGTDGEREGYGSVAAPVLRMGFWCHQAYKVLGVYDPATDLWVDCLDYFGDGANFNNLQWGFAEFTPDGIAAGSGESPNLLAIQWLMPNDAESVLDVGYVSGDFVMGAVDSIPAANCDWGYVIDGPLGGELTGAVDAVGGTWFSYNSTYSVDITHPGTVAVGASQVNIATTAGGAPGAGLDQYEIVFVAYEVNAATAFQADGNYFATYTAGFIP